MIRINRANPAPPGSTAAKGKIARDRNVNANNASAKKAVAGKRVAANTLGVSNTGDKLGYHSISERREVPSAAFNFSRCL